MSEIHVAALQMAEIDAVARLHAQCFDDAWGPATLRRVLAMPGTFGLTARTRSPPAMLGFALARIAAYECELLSLGVDPAMRSRGIGARLLIATMARAVAGAAPRFFLEVAEDNAAAQKLYTDHGLVPIGRRPNYYTLKDGARIAAVTMCRLLDGAADQSLRTTSR
jgi:[ribosomal protein S18]-alanine N-acetyltransferase